jgi:hypothetical protein
MATRTGKKRAPRLAVLLAFPIVLSNAAPALGSVSFKASDHDWVVAVNASSLHDVPAGGSFSYCSSQDISAITPSITYTGAPVGGRYVEEVIGPKAAGTITITGTRNVDGDLKQLIFAKPSGALGNTYATLSFPGTFHHSTLPPGMYSFEVLIEGKALARTTLTLVARAGC